MAIALATLLLAAPASLSATGASPDPAHGSDAPAVVASPGPANSAAEQRRVFGVRIAQASNPDGVRTAAPEVISPPRRPRPRPDGINWPGADGEGLSAPVAVSAIRPEPRPAQPGAGAAEARRQSTSEDAGPGMDGGGSPESVAASGIRPSPRPARIVARAAEVRRQPTPAAAGLLPVPRPARLAAAYAKRRQASASARRNGKNSPAEIGDAAVYPARMAKNRISVVSISGKAQARRAIVRLRNGRYLTVETGQTVGGWRVAEITGSTVLLVSGDRRRTLQVPD